MDLLTQEELLELGFESVGQNTMVSRDARFYSISGKIGDYTRIDAFAILTGHIELDTHVHISPFSFLGGTGGKIHFMDNSGISTHVSIFTKSDNYRNNSLENKEQSKIIGDVTIGKNSIIGFSSVVMPGVTVSENVSIGANSIIARNVNAGEIIISKGVGLITLSVR